MLKRILNIVIHPFYVLYLIISFPLKFIMLLLTNRKEKPLVGTSVAGQIELLEAGELLFPLHKAEFQNFFGMFLKDKNRFLSENKGLLENYNNFELEKLTAIEVVYIFGDSKDLVCLTDWRGEENEGEIENFLETRQQIEVDWKNVNKLRGEVAPENQSDGKFIIKLLKAVDTDLEPIHKKLVFLALGWDAYVYTAVPRTTIKKIIGTFGSLVYVTENLNK